MPRRSVVIATTGLALVVLATVVPKAAEADSGRRSFSHGDAGYAARVHFVKHLVDPEAFVFNGTTTGAAHGTLRSNLLTQIATAGDYSIVSFRWTVSAHKHSLVAQTTGTINNATGEVSMSGSIVSGWNQGARILELGQGDGAGNFEGDLVILLPQD
jgi:hypothetical protein